MSIDKIITSGPCKVNTTDALYCVPFQDLLSANSRISNHSQKMLSSTRLQFQICSWLLNTLFVFLVSCDCKVPVALPCSGVGWSAVCDFGIS